MSRRTEDEEFNAIATCVCMVVAVMCAGVSAYLDEERVTSDPILKPPILWGIQIVTMWVTFIAGVLAVWDDQ